MTLRITGYATPSALGKRVTDRDSRKGVNRTLCGKAARMRCSPPTASRVRIPPLARTHQPDGAGETGAGIAHRVPDVSDHVVEGEPVDNPGAAPMGQRVDADYVVAVPADRV